MWASSVSQAISLLKRKFSSAETAPEDATQKKEQSNIAGSAVKDSEHMEKPNNINSNTFSLLEQDGDGSSGLDEDEAPAGDEGAASGSTKQARRREKRKKQKADREAAAAAASASAATPQAPSRLLLLVGLPGSGKSTLAEAILAAGGSRWARVSQDELGSRQLCEARVEELLNERLNVIVDRCNHDPRQRGVWISMARRARAAPVEVVLLDVPVDECMRRVMKRPSHPTLNTAARSPQALASVVYSFSKNFVPPSNAEGFGKLHVFNATHTVAHIVTQLQL